MVELTPDRVPPDESGESVAPYQPLSDGSSAYKLDRSFNEPNLTPSLPDRDSLADSNDGQKSQVADAASENGYQAGSADQASSVEASSRIQSVRRSITPTREGGLATSAEIEEMQRQLEERKKASEQEDVPQDESVEERGRTISRRSLLKLGGGLIASLIGAKVAQNIFLSGDDKKAVAVDVAKDAEPAVTLSVSPTEVATVAPVENLRPLMDPKEVPVSQDLAAALKTELGEDTEVLHEYQGEYIKFVFAIDNRVKTRTTSLDRFGSSVPSNDITDFGLSDRFIQEVYGVSVDMATLIKRWEDMELIADIMKLRNSEKFYSVFPLRIDDPNETQNLELLKKMIREGKAPQVIIDGHLLNVDKPHITKVVKDDPITGRLTASAGYKTENLQGKSFEGSPVREIWEQQPLSEENYLALGNQNLAKGLITKAQYDQGYSAHGWVRPLEAVIAQTIVASTDKEIADIYEKTLSTIPTNSDRILKTMRPLFEKIVYKYDPAITNTLQPGIISISQKPLTTTGK